MVTNKGDILNCSVLLRLVHSHRRPYATTTDMRCLSSQDKLVSKQTNIYLVSRAPQTSSAGVQITLTVDFKDTSWSVIREFRPWEREKEKLRRSRPGEETEFSSENGRRRETG